MTQELCFRKIIYSNNSSNIDSGINLKQEPFINLAIAKINYCCGTSVFSIYWRIYTFYESSYFFLL